MKIVAVTACIAGLAHTYMAKSSLEKAANKKGYEIKVETQGSMGVENRLEHEEIESADIVIFAVDTSVSDRDRFEGKKILEFSTQEAMRNGSGVIEQAEEIVRE